MSIATYTDLKAAIADWLLRDDLTAVIPTFISLAEADINRRVRHWRMEKRATTELDSQYSALPFDFISPIRMSITGNRFAELEAAGQAEMLALRSGNNNGSGTPQYYSITSGEIEVYPSPAGTFTLEMAYYGRIAALGDANADNWMLTYSPDVYLYGALLQAAPYLKDDERIGVWKGIYDQALAGLVLETDKAKFGGSGLRLKIRSY
jgi:hypothetical protein